MPDVAFVLADSPYQDMESIITYQGVEQFGTWVNLFVPMALAISEWRADFDVAAVSPTTAVGQDAVSSNETPILLIHSDQDEYTPPDHSATIFANSNPESTVLYIANWGAPHGQDIFYEPELYADLVDDFLAEHAPDFGLQP